MGLQSLSGIVKRVDKEYILIELEDGTTTSIPRFFGEVPAVDSTVVVDYSSGDAKIYTAPPVSAIVPIKRYMNFYAVEADGNTPSDVSQLDYAPDGSITETIAPFSPFSFADTPAGSRTLAASNGNMVFSSSTAVGLVTACDSKLIVRDDGTLEMVTPHFMALMGRTVVVNAFHDDLSIEIDLTSTVNNAGSADVSGIKQAISDKILGISGDPMTYEEAFYDSIGGSLHEPFYQMFGMHLAELLLSFKWERFKYTGNETTFAEVFGTLGAFESIYSYCAGCYNNDRISSLEVFLIPDYSFAERGTVQNPSCVSIAESSIDSINTFFNEVPYSVPFMTMRLHDGTLIEYAVKKRQYSLDYGVMSKKHWNSSEQAATYANNLTVNVDSLSLPDITISPETRDYCGRATPTPTITWGGDFLFNIIGSATIISEDEMFLFGGTSATLAGGTKGILVDSNGSSAITL